MNVNRSKRIPFHVTGDFIIYPLVIIYRYTPYGTIEPCCNRNCVNDKWKSEKLKLKNETTRRESFRVYWTRVTRSRVNRRMRNGKNVDGEIKLHSLKYRSVEYRYPCECALSDYLWLQARARALKYPLVGYCARVHTPDENDATLSIALLFQSWDKFSPADGEKGTRTISSRKWYFNVIIIGERDCDTIEFAIQISEDIFLSGQLSDEGDPKDVSVISHLTYAILCMDFQCEF